MNIFDSNYVTYLQNKRLHFEVDYKLIHVAAYVILYKYQIIKQISTMEHTLQTLKQDPTKLTLLPTLLQSFLESKQSQQTQYTVSAQLVQLLQKIQQKLDKKKQINTYQLIHRTFTRLVQVLLLLIQESRMGSLWGTVAKIVEVVEQTQTVKNVLDVLVNLITQDNKIQYQSIQSGYLIKKIIESLTPAHFQSHPSEILHFLLTLPHDSSITDGQIQYKKCFQQALISSLEYLQKLSIEDQANIYNKLGDKVFSKLATPLKLSQFLLDKLKNQQQHPMIVIEVLAAIFILVGKYGLELEKFYDNLQNIISKKRPVSLSLFRLKNSKRFLKLMEAAMRSSKVPFKNILTLCKLLLQAIPRQRSQLVFWLLSFFVNLVKKHRQLQNHLNQFPQIETLKYHYSAKVRSLIKQLSKNLNKSEYLDIEDFSVVNCKKLCNQKLQEIVQKMGKCQDALQFKIPNSIDYL